MNSIYTEKDTFSNFKSNVCHRVKYLGDKGFILEVLKDGVISDLYNKKWYPECLYTLAMIDYLSRINEVPLCKEYNAIRCQKLPSIVYPTGIYLSYLLTKDENILKESYENSIPEFKRFNIVENEVRRIA